MQRHISERPLGWFVSLSLEAHVQERYGRLHDFNVLSWLFAEKPWESLLHPARRRLPIVVWSDHSLHVSLLDLLFLTPPDLCTTLTNVVNKRGGRSGQ